MAPLQVAPPPNTVIAVILAADNAFAHFVVKSIMAFLAIIIKALFGKL
jgi:hypothetical protein